MNWHKGLRRLELVGTVALGLGLVSTLSLYVTSALGYVPDPAIQPLLRLAPLGVVLLGLGAVLLLVVWVLRGFIPDSPTGTDAHPR